MNGIVNKLAELADFSINFDKALGIITVGEDMDLYLYDKTVTSCKLLAFSSISHDFFTGLCYTIAWYDCRVNSGRLASFTEISQEKHTTTNNNHVYSLHIGYNNSNRISVFAYEDDSAWYEAGYVAIAFKS